MIGKAHPKKKSKWREAILAIFLFTFLAAVTGAIWIETSRVNIGDLPKLQNADIIFQTSRSSQSSAILLATRNFYTHMGLIKLTSEGPFVIEAGAAVRETPLQIWIDKGYLGRITIMRMKGMSGAEADSVLKKAQMYYGQPYDPFFMMSEDRQYCSELVWRSYKGFGLKLGSVQKIGSLSLTSDAVRSLVKKRWQSYPLCEKKSGDFEACWQRILHEDIITPASIAADDKLETVFSNYY